MCIYQHGNDANHRGDVEMETYNIKYMAATIERKAHIVEYGDNPTIHLGLYKSRGGYCVDHCRTGLAVSALNQSTTLKDAKANVIKMLNEGYYERIVEANKNRPALNPEYEA